MDPKPLLIARLTASNPGWSEWRKLIALVRSIDFEFVTCEYLGNFYACGARLVFAELTKRRKWPDWLPGFVPALYGMKRNDWEMAGGYADSFRGSGKPAKKGAVFSWAGNDQELGFPLIDVPKGIYPFQSNSSGATFFINKKLDVLYPNSENERFEILDDLETFSRTNIRQILHGEEWFMAYSSKIKSALID